MAVSYSRCVYSVKDLILFAAAQCQDLLGRSDVRCRVRLRLVQVQRSAWNAVHLRRPSVRHCLQPAANAGDKGQANGMSHPPTHTRTEKPLSQIITDASCAEA